MNFNGSNFVKYGKIMKFTGNLNVHFRAYMDNWANCAAGTALVSCTQNGGWSIYNSSGYITVDMYSASTSSYVILKTSKTWASLSSGWHIFDLIYAADTPYKLYLDGTLLATSATFTGKIGYNTTNGIFAGGEAGDNETTPTSGYFTGRIGNLIISDTTTMYSATDFTRMRIPAQNVTVYADWTPNTYTITYNANGGSGAPGATTYTYSDTGATKLSTTVPTRENYTFLGWSRTNTATTPDYTAGQSWNLNNDANYTLYAVWKRNQFTVSFNSNGGTSINLTQFNQTFNYGETTYDVYCPRLEQSNLFKFGYTPLKDKYWNTSPNGTGISMDQNVVISASTLETLAKQNNNNVIFYTMWRPAGRSACFQTTSSVKFARPYVFTDGTWHKGMYYVYTNNGWTPTIEN